jgi:hypothetical protein
VATSGVYTWTPTLANLIDEACERAGINPATLTHQHLISARNSLNYVFRELETEQVDQFYRIDQESTAVSAATYQVSLASGSVEVLQLWYRNSGATTDIPITRISREDYQLIPTKASTGKPTMAWVDHSSLNAPQIVLWPVPDAAITLYYDRLRFIDDALALSNTADAHRFLYDVIAYALAARLCEKYAPERYPLNQSRYRETLIKAKAAIIPRGDVMIYGVQTRRRRA